MPPGFLCAEVGCPAVYFPRARFGAGESPTRKILYVVQKLSKTGFFFNILCSKGRICLAILQQSY